MLGIGKKCKLESARYRAHIQRIHSAQAKTRSEAPSFHICKHIPAFRCPVTHFLGNYLLLNSPAPILHYYWFFFFVFSNPSFYLASTSFYCSAIPGNTADPGTITSRPWRWHISADNKMQQSLTQVTKPEHPLQSNTNLSKPKRIICDSFFLIYSPTQSDPFWTSGSEKSAFRPDKYFSCIHPV